MVSYDLADGKILLHPKPDKVEKPPFPVYRNVWTFSSRQLARFSVDGHDVVHDCGAIVATVQTGSALAMIVGALAGHVCETA